MREASSFGADLQALNGGFRLERIPQAVLTVVLGGPIDRGDPVADTFQQFAEPELKGGRGDPLRRAG